MELGKNNTTICKQERKKLVMVYLRSDEDSIRKLVCQPILKLGSYTEGMLITTLQYSVTWKENLGFHITRIMGQNVESLCQM
jgi:hypothetical protein